MKHNKYIEVLIVLLIPIIVYGIWSIFFYFYSPLIPIKDAFYYKKMAETPFDPNIMAPFCFRILTPLIAYFIPFDSGNSFFYTNFVIFILTAMLFYYFLKRLNFNKKYSILGEIIFTAGSITSIYLIHNFIMVDQLNQLLFLLGCYFLISKKTFKSYYTDIFFMLILAVGVLNKETILFLIPIYFILKSGPIYKKISMSILISCPAILIFTILRLFIPYSGTYEELWFLFHIENLQSTLYNIFLTFGPLWFMAFFNFDCKNKFLRYSYWILPLFIFQIILASNIFRLIFLSFPIVIPLALLEFKKYNKEFNKIPIIIAISSQILITIMYILKKYLELNVLNFIYFPLIVISTTLLFIISLRLYFKQ